MSVPVVIQFLAETDDLLAQTKAVQSNVVDMVGATKATVSAVESLVNETTAQVRAMASATAAALQEEADNVSKRFKGVEESVKGVIQSIQATAETVAGAITPLVDKVRESVEGLTETIESTAKKAGAGFVALGAGTIVAGGAALEAGRGYEDLRARLQGLTGDLEKSNALFNEAVGFAASTPFSVGEIVDATAQLKAFGQEGAENLRLVAEISAASGQSLSDTALRTGKALAGISEGFQGLRDTSGITADRLVRFGAVMNDSGGIAVKTADQIGKARAALLALGRAEFAGNIERQSQTYSGALSNAGDAVTNFAAVIGAELIPIASLAVRGFSSLVSAATSVVQYFSPVIPVLGLMSLGVSALGVALSTGAALFAGYIARAVIFQSAITGANLVLGRFGLSLAAVKTQLLGLVLANNTAAAAITAIQGAVGAASARFVAMRASVAATASSFTLLSAGPLLGIGAAALVLNEGLKYMERQAKAAGEEIARAGSAFQSAAQDVKKVNNVFEAVSGKGLTFGATVRENAQEAEAALKGMSDIQILNGINATGESLESLQSKLIQNAAQSDLTKTKIAELTEQLEKAKSASNFSSGKDGLGPSPEELARIEQLEFDLRAANDQFQNLGRSSAGIRVLVDRVSDLSPALQKAKADAESLEPFLKFAAGLESVGQIGTALGEVDAKIRETGASIQQAFGTTDRFALGLKLAQPDVAKNKEAVEAIEKYLGLLDSREKLEEKIVKIEGDAAKATAEAAKEKIKAYETETARKKALGELSLQQERARIEGELDLVAKGSEEETKILERLAAKDQEIRAKREELAKSSLAKQVQAIEESVTATEKAPGSSAAQVSTALRSAIASLEAFGAAQKEAFSNAPEAAEAYRQKLVALKQELESSAGKELEDNLKNLKSTLESGIDSGGTTAQQLLQIGTAITSLKAAIASKTVEQTGAEEYLSTLEEKKLGLIREQTNEKLKQVDEILALQQAALDGEIQVLEARKAAGENVERELAAANQARTQLALDNIDAVLQKEIDGGADRTLAEQKAALAREAIFKREALTKYQSAAKADKDIDQLGRRRGGNGGVGDFRPAFNPSSGPFGSSPFSQGGLGVSVNATAVPDFANNFGRKILREAPKAPNFNAIYRETKQAAAKVGPGSASTLPETYSKGQVINATLNISGGSSDPDERDLVRKSAAILERQARLDKLNGRDNAKKSGSPLGYGAAK